MIRPYTIFCVILAGASGLFLYSKKHQTNVLDQNIRTIVQHTNNIRQQTAMLQSQWALLNQPDRLQALSARFLTGLTPMAPEQYKRLSTAIASLPRPGSAAPQHDLMIAAAAPTAPHTPEPSRVVQPAPVQLARLSETAPAADLASHHVVTDRPQRSAPAMLEHVEPVARAHVSSSVRYATYHGARAVATPAMAWRSATGGPLLNASRSSRTDTAPTRYAPPQRRGNQSAFALADDALPPPMPLAD